MLTMAGCELEGSEDAERFVLEVLVLRLIFSMSCVALLIGVPSCVFIQMSIEVINRLLTP